MLSQIRGLHHVTSMASDARANNAFFTDTPGHPGEGLMLPRRHAQLRPCLERHLEPIE